MSILWIIGVFSWSRNTYYKQDTSLMYLATVPNVIKSLAESVTLQKGVQLEERLTAQSEEP